MYFSELIKIKYADGFIQRFNFVPPDSFLGEKKKRGGKGKKTENWRKLKKNTKMIAAEVKEIEKEEK